MNANRTREAVDRGREILTGILVTLNDGGYIFYDDNTAPILYDHNGTTVKPVPLATVQRIAALLHFTEWEEAWGGHYVSRENGSRHNAHTNTEHCRSIADYLGDYAAGLVVRCPECGQTHTVDGSRPAYRCGGCGYTGDIGGFEQLSIYDYLEDSLDIEYRSNSRREYRSVRIMVACGGPNIYIDSDTASVNLYWWGDRAEYPLDSDTVAALDEWAEELWGCM